MTPRIHTVSLLISLLVSALPTGAHASMNLALDKGCLSCHGTPPRGKAPALAELATRYATAKGNEAEVSKLIEHLREHHLFGGVPAHERLSTEEAERFVRWLVDGAR
jgi:cytochrome c